MYIETLAPPLEAGLLELCDPDPGEVVFSCQRKVVQQTSRVIRGVHSEPIGLVPMGLQVP